MNINRVKKALKQIYRMAEASEKGYATAATNVPNPGLKILFKHIARQRARYKTEILAELNRLGDTVQPLSSIPGMIHRGRINIFAFIFGEEEEKEKTVLKEVALGEKFARRVYQGALAQELPAGSQEMIRRQLEELVEITELIKKLQGHSNEKIYVQLVGSENQARTFSQWSNQPGTVTEMFKEIDLSAEELYQGQAATVFETILSGAFGGALWGGLIGLLAGFGVVQTTFPAPVGLWDTLGLWALVAFGLMAAGTFISSGLALFIGLGTSEDGAAQYRNETGRYRIRLLSVVSRSPANQKVRNVDGVS